MKVLKFSAIWCPGCLIMNPRWDKIKETYKDIEFIDYDYDMDEVEVNKWNIGDTLPVVIILDNNNEELERLVGEYSLSIIQKCKKYDKKLDKNIHNIKS